MDQFRFCDPSEIKTAASLSALSLLASWMLLNLDQQAFNMTTADNEVVVVSYWRMRFTNLMNNYGDF